MAETSAAPNLRSPSGLHLARRSEPKFGAAGEPAGSTQRRDGTFLTGFGAALTLVSVPFCYARFTVQHLLLVGISGALVVAGIIRLRQKHRWIALGILLGLALAGVVYAAAATRNRASALATLAGLLGAALVAGSPRKGRVVVVVGAMTVLVAGFAARSLLSVSSSRSAIEYTLPKSFEVRPMPAAMENDALRDDRKVYSVNEADGVALAVFVGETREKAAVFFEKVVGSIPREATVVGRGEIETRGVSCPYFDYEVRHPELGAARGRYLLVPCAYRYTLLVLGGDASGVARNLPVLEQVADSVTCALP